MDTLERLLFSSDRRKVMVTTGPRACFYSKLAMMLFLPILPTGTISDSEWGITMYCNSPMNLQIMEKVELGRVSIQNLVIK